MDWKKLILNEHETDVRHEIVDCAMEAWKCTDYEKDLKMHFLERVVLMSPTAGVYYRTKLDTDEEGCLDNNGDLILMIHDFPFDQAHELESWDGIRNIIFDRVKALS